MFWQKNKGKKKASTMFHVRYELHFVCDVLVLAPSCLNVGQFLLYTQCKVVQVSRHYPGKTYLFQDNFTYFSMTFFFSVTLAKGPWFRFLLIITIKVQDTLISKHITAAALKTVLYNCGIFTFSPLLL